MAKPITVGSSFETQILHTARAIPGMKAIKNFEMYSHKLGSETAIDVLVFGKKFTYILEAKNFSTSLAGNLYDRTWVGVSKGKTYNIFNPVIQNWEHLRAFLGMKKNFNSPIQTFVVVPSFCEVFSDSSEVITLDELTRIWKNNEF